MFERQGSGADGRRVPCRGARYEFRFRSLKAAPHEIIDTNVRNEPFRQRTRHRSTEDDGLRVGHRADRRSDERDLRRDGRRQTNANSSLLPADEPLSGSQKLPSFLKRGVSFGFEYRAAAEVAIKIEMAIERSVCRGEFLKGRHPSESRHCSLSSPERQMAVLGPIV